MRDKNIRVFDLNFDRSFIENFQMGSEKILKRAFLTNDEYVNKFEDLYAKWNNSHCAIATTNGTAALEMSCRAIGVRGKKVVIPSNTFIATAVAVINAGGIPIICDVEDQYFSLCPVSLSRQIESHEISAVITVHIGGHISPSFMEIQSLCKQNNISLIEDSAHAHGATLNGRKSGTLADYGCFSFFTTKIMTTGEGGMILCQSTKNKEKLKSIRQFGMDLNNNISHIQDGSNFKLTEFQALMGCLELERIDKRIEKRISLAKRYQENLSNSSWRCITDTKDSKGSYYKQIIISPIDRGVVENTLNNNGVSLTGGVYYIPLHRQPVFQSQYNDKDFPNSNFFSDNHFCPPCYPELEPSDIDYICDILLGIQK